MKNALKYLVGVVMFLLFFPGLKLLGQEAGLKTISESELRYHLEFLGSEVFRGRETPSPELEIATQYIGNWCKAAGVEPFLTDGSYYQAIPISVTSVFQPNTRLRVISNGKESTYYYEDSFGGSFSQTGSCNGDVIFTGLGLLYPEKGWDDLRDIDLFGKVVVIMDAQHPDNSYDLGFTYSYRLSTRIREIRNRGAAAVLVIIDPERETKRKNGEMVFADIPAGRMSSMYDSQRRGTSRPQGQRPEGTTPSRPYATFLQADISHAVASAILGIPEEEIADMFNAALEGEQVPGRILPGVTVNLSVEVRTYPSSTRNVLGLIEGTDPELKNEYIVICAHHDHLGISDGEIIAGADDNGSGTVALMEIAQALVVDPPDRSVIVAWFTGEERGFIGSQYFINNLPVPVEKIDACLNMDMISRNHIDSLYLVGSDLLSSGLDAAIHTVNKASGINFGFDYLYSNLTHPQSVYFRSDQYPHIRFGIPSVWFFSGFTHDYHTPADITANVDYEKMLKVTRLVYLTAYEIGNMGRMLKLDVNPEVTSRGKHNLPTRSLFENTR